MAERDPVLGNEGGGGEAISLLPEDPPSSGEDAFDHVSLLDGGSMERGGGAVDVDRPGSSSFRQRSMHLNSPFSVEADANGSDHHRSVPLDSDNCCGGGMIHSASRAKLEADGRFVSGTFTAGDVARTLLFILIWYTFSTCLTLYNKELLGDKLGKFPAPLLMNTVHFTLQAVLSKIVLWFQTRKLDGKVIMTWKDYLLTVVPTALGTALDINLSNASLVFISVTFATMCKSASPIFLLVFAFAFRLESPSIKLFGIIFIISFGVLLTVAKETEFDFWGFIFVMLAAVMSGFRWCMTQILLQKDTYGLKNPITLMSYVAPVMALSSFILSLIMDPWHEFDSNTYFNSSWHVIRSCILMAIGGTLAFFMVLTEYILVSATSAVTVTIAGVVKEAVTIVVAVLYFHDQFTWLKATGLVIILVGVSLFNWYKYQKMNKAHHSDSEGAASMKYSILDKIDPQEDNI